MISIKQVGYARLIAFVLLAAITVFGFYKFLEGDWTTVVEYWSDNTHILLLLVLVSTVDVTLEMTAWMWVYKRFGVKMFDRSSVYAFLTGRAGLILPAQLGRLMRPDAIVKLERAKVPDALKAEAVVFIFDAMSVVALIAGLIVYLKFPLLAPVAALALIAVMLLLGNTINHLLTRTHLKLPAKFWWAWPTAGIIFINMSGWIAHGVALHVVVADLPGDMTLWDSMVMGPGSAVLGVATGLPGGLGATEGLLGASLHMRSVPAEHLAVAIAAFRLVTFWLWIPVGWVAIALLRRRKARVLAASKSAILHGEGL